MVPSTTHHSAKSDGSSVDKVVQVKYLEKPWEDLLETGRVRNPMQWVLGSLEKQTDSGCVGVGALSLRIPSFSG